MHSDLAGAELHEVGSIHVRAPNKAAAGATAHGEDEVPTVATAGKPTGTDYAGADVVDVCAIGQRTGQLNASGRVVSVDNLAIGSPNDAGNTVGAADAAGDLARWRERSRTAKAGDPQAAGERYLGGGQRGTVGGDAGSAVKI